MTTEQATALTNLRLREEDATSEGTALVFAWHGDTILIVNAHGSVAVYPKANAEHALRAHR